ncbi:MAG: DsbA family protein [Acidimicrobiales bacterium]
MRWSRAHRTVAAPAPLPEHTQPRPPTPTGGRRRGRAPPVDAVRCTGPREAPVAVPGPPPPPPPPDPPRAPPPAAPPPPPPDTLRRAALDVGLDADEVEAVLVGDAFADEVRADLDAARQIGVNGVPFFVVDGRLGMSGAQPPESLLELLDQGWLTREPAPVSILAEGDVCGPEGCEN